VYILDNFHKQRDFGGKQDERVRFKALSEAMKNLALRRKCCMLCSVEYTKLQAGVKPTNHNIAESVQLSYDANAIIHVYNEMSDNPESFNLYHRGKDWKGDEKLLPRVEFIVGKNKISEDRRSFFLDFFPASSDYAFVSQETVLQEVADNKKAKLQKDPISKSFNDTFEE
jgi:hypothetical protein